MKESIKKRIEAVRRGEVPEGYRIANGYLIPKEWKTVPLNSRFTRSTRKNSTGCEKVLTISAQMGLVNQREFYDKDIASEDKSGYFLMKNGEFAYNKSYSTGYPYGAIKQLTRYDEGIVSPLYICFTPKAGTNTAFYTQYFEGGRYNHEIYRVAQEGARNHGLLNIAVEDFFTGTLVEPSAGEQQKIAKTLATCDRMIELKQSKIDELKKLKQVCLLEMFPQKGQTIPKRRFPGFSAPWEQRKLGDLSVEFKSGEFICASDIMEDGEYPVFGGNGLRGFTNHYNHDGEYALIGRQGALCGNVNYAVGKSYFTEHAVAVKANKANQTRFLYYLFSTMNLGQYSGQSAQPGLAVGNLVELENVVPSKPEQEKIAGFLSSLDHLITLHQRELAEVGKYKKALMQLLLTGLVRVNV